MVSVVTACILVPLRRGVRVLLTVLVHALLLDGEPSDLLWGALRARVMEAAGVVGQLVSCRCKWYVCRR